MTTRLHVDAVGDGPPLVLLHGWAMHAGMWGPVLPQLAARYRVYAVDLPGHGRSAGVEAAGLPQMAAVVADSLAYLGSTTILGWSLGAAVAMQWALTAPGSVARLFLVGATPRFVAAADWPHAMDETTLMRFGDEMRAAYKLTLKRFLSLQLQGSDRGRAALASLRQQLFARGEPPAAGLARGFEILRSLDLRSAVPRISQRAVVIAGERDTLTPLAAGRWLANALPRGRLAAIPGAAHVPFLSHPDAFLAALPESGNGA